jgi:hypothetical protein
MEGAGAAKTPRECVVSSGRLAQSVAHPGALLRPVRASKTSCFRRSWSLPARVRRWDKLAPDVREALLDVRRPPSASSSRLRGSTHIRTRPLSGLRRPLRRFRPQAAAGSSSGRHLPRLPRRRHPRGQHTSSPTAHAAAPTSRRQRVKSCRRSRPARGCARVTVSGPRARAHLAGVAERGLEHSDWRVGSSEGPPVIDLDAFALESAMPSSDPSAVTPGQLARSGTVALGSSIRHPSRAISL